MYFLVCGLCFLAMTMNLLTYMSSKEKGSIKENAKFQVLPEVKLLENNGLQPNELKMAEMIIEENVEVITKSWNRFFQNNL